MRGGSDEVEEWESLLSSLSSGGSSSSSGSAPSQGPFAGSWKSAESSSESSSGGEQRAASFASSAATSNAAPISLRCARCSSISRRSLSRRSLSFSFARASSCRLRSLSSSVSWTTSFSRRFLPDRALALFFLLFREAASAAALADLTEEEAMTAGRSRVDLRALNGRSDWRVVGRDIIGEAGRTGDSGSVVLADCAVEVGAKTEETTPIHLGGVHLHPSAHPPALLSASGVRQGGEGVVKQQAVAAATAQGWPGVVQRCSGSLWREQGVGRVERVEERSAEWTDMGVGGEGGHGAVAVGL